MNFSFARVWTIVLHIFYGSRHDFNRLAEITYWPFIDILLFGFIGVSFASSQQSNLMLAFLGGLVLWQVAYRTNLEISRNILQELRDKNLINLLATPLSTAEWIMGLMLTGGIVIIFTCVFGAACVCMLYHTNIFAIGFPLGIFVALLAMSGWVLGLLSASVLMRWGQRVETVVWAIGWLPAPFCSVYYPTDVLPAWAQTISKCLPMTYVFEALRVYIKTGILSYSYILMAIVLLGIYLTAALCLFFAMLHHRKNKGLTNI